MYKFLIVATGLELYVDPSIASDLIAISESFGVSAQIVGKVEANSVLKNSPIGSEYGTFEY